MSGCRHQGGGGICLTSNDDDERQGLTPEDLEFRQLLDSTIVEIYPVVLDRVRSAQFAGWQRSVQREMDVANQACAEFYAQCVRHSRLPDVDDLLAYVVKIAINIANRQYSEHMDVQEILVDPEDPALGKLFASDENDGDEELSRFDKWLREFGREERLLRALSQLTPRQREAFELWIANPTSTYAELGRRMNISEDGFRKNFDRACDALEAILNPNHHK